MLFSGELSMSVISISSLFAAFSFCFQFPMDDFTLFKQLNLMIGNCPSPNLCRAYEDAWQLEGLVFLLIKHF